LASDRLCLLFGLLGGRTSGVRGLVCESPGIDELFRSVGDQLFRGVAGLFGVIVRVRNLVLHFLLSFPSSLLGLGLGGLPFAPHQLVSGFLRFVDALLDLPIRLTLDLPDPSLPPFADLFHLVSLRLGILRSLSCPFFSFAGTLGGVLRSPKLDLYGVTAKGSCINYGGLDPPPLITSIRHSRSGRILDSIYRLESPGQ
jgi:hypothetical protein